MLLHESQDVMLISLLQSIYLTKVTVLIPADALGTQNQLSSFHVTLNCMIDQWEQSDF